MWPQSYFWVIMLSLGGLNIDFCAVSVSHRLISYRYLEVGVEWREIVV